MSALARIPAASWIFLVLVFVDEDGFVLAYAVGAVGLSKHREIGHAQSIGMNRRRFKMDFHPTCLGSSFVGPGRDRKRIQPILAAKPDPRLPGSCLPDDPVGVFDFNRLPRLHRGIEFHKVQLVVGGSGLPPCVVELLTEAVEALGENAGFHEAAEGFVIFLQRSEETGPKRGVC